MSKNCLLVYPKFTANSFWNYKVVCNLVGAHYPAAPLGLCTVAALLPEDWNCKLVDCNAEELRDEHIEWADIVLSGGMIAQQVHHRKLIERIKSFNKEHIVGGPDATSSPHLYNDATHLVLGEAEVSLPEFLADYKTGNAKQTYDAGARKADMSQSPVPAFELLKFENYLHIGIQYARGCPFNCEFCDIIELFGRVPRAKDPSQILAELQKLYDLGYRGHVDLVDDNFIGNRSQTKKLLREMSTWLKAHRWPFEFTTEATINLADDKELMGLMQEVGFWAIFVGIESPDEETLKVTQKGQNTRRSIPDSIQKIYEYGMIVNAGYIVGLDGEKGRVSKGTLQCIKDTSIPVNMVGLMFALPNTQLTRRLEKEGRLEEQFDIVPDDSGDQCLGGLNFSTLRPKREILEDYEIILSESYTEEEYFQRVLNVALKLNCSKKRLKLPLRTHLRDLRAFARLINAMGIQSPYRKYFWHVLLQCALKNPKAIRYTVGLVALYMHFGPFKDHVITNIRQKIDRLGIEEQIHTDAINFGPVPYTQNQPARVAQSEMRH